MEETCRILTGKVSGNWKLITVLGASLGKEIVRMSSG